MTPVDGIPLNPSASHDGIERRCSDAEVANRLVGGLSTHQDHVLPVSEVYEKENFMGFERS